MSESQPAWATETPVNATPYREPSVAGGDGYEHPHKQMTVRLCAFLNIGLSFMLACNGALAVGSSSNSSDAGAIFVGLYLVGFAAILFTYEFLQLAPLEALDNIFKRNFGFLYGSLGKSCYLLFIGILAFGLNSPSWSIATGILTVAWAFIHAGLAVMKPELFDKKVKYDPSQ